MSTFTQVTKYESMKDLPKEAPDKSLAIVDDCHPFIYQASNKIWVPVKFDTKMGADLYTLNKTGFDGRPPLSDTERQELSKNLRRFYRVDHLNNKYFMLLNNRDIHYYTLFEVEDVDESLPSFDEEVLACLDYLGEILAAEEDEGKFEIWIRPKPEVCDEPAIALYLFPYDEGVILCR